MIRSVLLVTLSAVLYLSKFGFCATRYSGRDRILLFNNDIFFGASKMPNRYNFRYLTDGRQYREEAGYTVKRGVESIMKVRGKFYYTGDDGRVYETVYEADENGYRPVSRIVGGVKYPYPERFPAPLPDLPLRPDEDDDLIPFGTEYGARTPTPNRSQSRQRQRPRPRPTTTTTTTTPFPEDEDQDKQNQYDNGEDDYDYPITGNGEKRDTKNQSTNNQEQDTEEESVDEASTDSYAETPTESSAKVDPEAPATNYQPPPKNQDNYKPPRHKTKNEKKTLSGAGDRSDSFFDDLFGN